NRGHTGGCTMLKRSQLKVCSRTVLLGQQPDFESLTHELSHSLFTVDLYGDACHSEGLTLISCTSLVPDAKNTLYLDPFHPPHLGWFVPYDAMYPYEMGDETWPDPRAGRTRPAIIRNPSNLSEYYLFEYRGGCGYDANVADFGIVAWHITEDANHDLIQS